MGFNKAFEDKKFMIFYVRKLSKLFEKNNNKALIPSLENILKDLNEK